MPIALLYVTCKDSQEASLIATKLLNERLIACANILPGTVSYYRWEGKITTTEEVIMLAKTMKKLEEKVISRIAELHSYACPAILSLPVGTAYPPFSQWVATETVA